MKHATHYGRPLVGVLILALSSFSAWGKPASVQWAVKAGFPGTPNKVVTDGKGNVYVTGSTYSAIPTATPPTVADLAASTSDMLTVKYDANGKKLWEVTYNSPYNGFDAGGWLVVDRTGNVFVSGTSFEPSAGYTGGAATVVKYSPTGKQLWAARYLDSAYWGSGGGVIDVDAAGNAYQSLSTIYDSDPTSTAIDGVIVKYDGNGNRIWKYLMAIGHYGDDWAGKVIVANGFVYVHGTFNGGDHCWGDETRNAMVWKLTLDGMVANTYVHDGGYADYSHDFTVDKSGNVYMATMSNRLSVTGCSFGLPVAYDFNTAKFDPSGNLLWSSRYNNTGNGDHDPNAIALDASGNVYVTGLSEGNGTTGKDLATLKYDGKTGALRWGNRFNGSANGNEVAGSVFIDSSGNALVTGSSLNTGSDLDYTAIKYASNGNRLWTVTYGKPDGAKDAVTSSALDCNDQLILSGSTTGASGVPQLLTAKLNRNQ